MNPLDLSLETAPYRLSGTVYGVLLNHHRALASMAPVADAAPYKGLPKAPVLYIKPRNTLARHGSTVRVPQDAPELEIGATLGVVIGQAACRVTESRAMGHVAGYTVVNDVSVPHDDYHRPSLRFKARDGFCPIGPRVVPRSSIADPDALALRVYVNGTLVHEGSTGERLRPVARLLADVSEFMTLHPGDLLMIGIDPGVPRVKAGQQVAIEIDGIGRLENRFEAWKETE